MMIKPNQIYLGDCLSVMQEIEDKSVDLILCDLPYGTTKCKWDTIIPFEPLWEQYKRIIKDNGAIVLTASQPFTSALVMSNPDMFKYEWIWDKKLSAGFLNAKIQPLNRHESILVFGIGKLKYNPQMEKREKERINKGTNKVYGIEDSAYGVRKAIGGNYTHRYPTTIQTISNANRAEKQHPTQKPLALCEYFVRSYTNENDLVLDNTMGSGTTCLAAKNLNRQFIGIEKEEKYFNIAKQRLNL